MVKELRLGNLILMNGEQTHVYQIEHRFKETYRINDIIIDARIIGDRFEGIELTPEWLIKFGFEKRHSDWSPFEIKMNYWVHECLCLFYNESPPKNTYLVGYADLRMGVYSVVTHRWINTVHDLQNIFHSFRGRELELTK